MSSTIATCPRCETVYWFAMVGSTLYGGHRCEMEPRMLEMYIARMRDLTKSVIARNARIRADDLIEEPMDYTPIAPSRLAAPDHPPEDES